MFGTITSREREREREIFKRNHTKTTTRATTNLISNVKLTVGRIDTHTKRIVESGCECWSSIASPSRHGGIGDDRGDDARGVDLADRLAGGSTVGDVNVAGVVDRETSRLRESGVDGGSTISRVLIGGATSTSEGGDELRLAIDLADAVVGDDDQQIAAQVEAATVRAADARGGGGNVVGIRTRGGTGAGVGEDGEGRVAGGHEACQQHQEYDREGLHGGRRRGHWHAQASSGDVCSGEREREIRRARE